MLSAHAARRVALREYMVLLHYKCPRRGEGQRAGLLTEMVVEMRQGLDPKGVSLSLSTNAVGLTPRCRCYLRVTPAYRWLAKNSPLAIEVLIISSSPNIGM